MQVEGVASKFENEPKVEHKTKKKKQSKVDEVIEKFIVVYGPKEDTDS